ncbi:MAG: PQQ-binding-like beta-propeller repeat protein [Candidatus Acidiferrum sp.]
MRRPLRVFSLAVLGVMVFAGTASAQRLELRWQKDFPKSVSWYVRTSAGVLLVKSGKSLMAVDGRDGRELWSLEDLRMSSTSLGDMTGVLDRGMNVLEVPGMGVLLLNAAKVPGNAERRLIALNLMTGEKLWDAPPVDIMMTAIPLYERGQIVIVSRRVQKKIYATEVAGAAMAGEFGPLVMSMLPFLYRFELERLDLATGKVQWNEEYLRTFSPGATSVSAFGDHLYIYFGDRFLGCVDLANGKVLWEDGAKPLRAGGVPLPLEMANGRLIYTSKDVQAVDPDTGKTVWTIEKLGKVTGIFAHDGLAVALGEKRMAAVDTASGVERWRVKTHGHTTNLLWEKGTDTLLYMDWKGLHRVERTTGKSLLDAPLQIDTPPHYLRMASPESVVAIGYRETDCFDTKTGKKRFAEDQLNAVFPGDASLDAWPLPEEGQGEIRMVSVPADAGEWESIQRRTLLPAAELEQLKESAAEPEGYWDVYQTEPEAGLPPGGLPKIWWVDGQTNRQMVIRPAGQKHDVSRPLGNVFAVNGKTLWTAKIEAN